MWRATGGRRSSRCSRFARTPHRTAGGREISSAFARQCRQDRHQEPRLAQHQASQRTVTEAILDEDQSPGERVRTSSAEEIQQVKHFLCCPAIFWHASLDSH